MRSLTVLGAVLVCTSTIDAQEKLSIDIYYGQNPKDYKVAILGPDVIEGVRAVREKRRPDFD